MIHLDTNYLILALVPGSEHDDRMRAWVAAGEPLGVCAVVWAEFRCGPVTREQVALGAAFVTAIEPFSEDDAVCAADFFNATGRRRGSLADCMIAAAAHQRGVALATSNLGDFKGFASLGLRLII